MSLVRIDALLKDTNNTLLYVQNFLSILITFSIENFQKIALSKNDNNEHRDSENNTSFKDVK